MQPREVFGIHSWVLAELGFSMTYLTWLETGSIFKSWKVGTQGLSAKISRAFKASTVSTKALSVPVLVTGWVPVGDEGRTGKSLLSAF